jgi:hypothetical protein
MIYFNRSYYRDMSTFSKGEYADANNKEDDLAILTGKLGARADDVGNTTATAKALTQNSTLGEFDF